MDSQKKRKFRQKGWSVGGIKDFLDLTEEEQKLIDLRIELGKILQDERKRCGYTQERLAEIISSSQSRVAKMEKGDTSVTLDLIIKTLLKIGATGKKISKAVASI